MSHVESCVIGSAPNRESAVCHWGRYIRWRSFLPYEIRKARSLVGQGGKKRERTNGETIRRVEGGKEKQRGKRRNRRVVGQWSVNRRHGVMTRLSFQRLHRRKSSARSCRLLSPPRDPSTPHAPIRNTHPFPLRQARATAWFLLQESIRWLQESGGFYVKILQKIMARYTFHRRGIAFRTLVALHSSLFPFPHVVLHLSS